MSPGPGPGDRVTLPRIRGYLRANLGDPALSAERIAAAHGLPVAALRGWAAGNGVDLERWIAAERLRAAREALRLAAAPPDEASALRAGFTGYDALNRAFLDSYGIGVRQWWEIRHEQ
ncbi:hypothetical protein [Nocardia harenae]|uniref:hypothetical protein n=1 Tax=Nocardia harenae TaxID=358707 RepID=UPI000836403E|nr:hypothetical protein [Nocardia harenae]